jgi:hypothetical protein
MEEKRKLSKRLRLETLEQGKDEVEKITATELDADEQADALEKDLDHLKALKIAETKLRSKVKRVSETRRRLRRKVLKNL